MESSPAAPAPPTPAHSDPAPGQPRIAIVGGSITGPVTALLLRRLGFREVVIYEATARARSTSGGVLGLSHPALHTIEELGIDQAEIVAHPSETVWTVTPAGRRQVTYAGRLTTWSLLHQALTTRLPGHLLHTATRVRDLATAGGRPILRLADGGEASADLVIFADGRASLGRARLAPERQTRYAGYVALRGHCTDGDGVSDFWRFEPAPGLQYTLGPTPDGLDWTMYLNAGPEVFGSWFGAAPTDRAYLTSRHVGPRVRDIADRHAARYLPGRQAAIVHATVDRAAVPITDTDPPARAVWPLGGGHAVLLGDALGPLRPHTGQGVNHGIEQAYGLALALSQHLRHGADLRHALLAWQHRHLPAVVAAVHHGPVLGRRLGLGVPARALIS